MQTKTVLAALFGTTALIATTAGGVYAAGTAGDDDTHDAQVVEAALAAPIGLVQAIEAAETATGGRTLEAEVEAEDGRVFYEIETLIDGQIHEVAIDPQTGGLLTTQIETAESDDLPPDGAIDIKTALAAAEVAGNGTVIEAEFEIENGQAIYDVEVAGDDGILSVTVDAASGEVMTVDADGDGDDDDDD